MRVLPIVVLTLWAISVQAIVFEQREFDSAEQEQLYRRLTGELRCLVCQNQSLAESEADLAGDLRKQIYDMLRSGADEEAVIDYMVARYGDFVRYRPPLKATTVALWVGPFLLVAAGLTMLYVNIRRKRARQLTEALSLEEQERLRQLLAEEASGEEGRS